MTISPYGYKPLFVILLICLLGNYLFLFQFPQLWPLSAVFILFFLFSLNFFRNPPQPGQSDTKLVYSPANGKVVEVLEGVDENEYIKGKSFKITIFLSVFDVHVNSSPVDGVVEMRKHVPGKKLNALDPRSSIENEYALVGVKLTSGVKLVVKQIAGLIARRIICDVKEGQALRQNEIIGMIRFGSRAEICIPADSGFSPTVKVGDVVKCGVSVLGNFK